LKDLINTWKGQLEGSAMGGGKEIEERRGEGNERE